MKGMICVTPFSSEINLSARNAQTLHSHCCISLSYSCPYSLPFSGLSVRCRCLLMGFEMMVNGNSGGLALQTLNSKSNKEFRVIQLLLCTYVIATQRHRCICSFLSIRVKLWQKCTVSKIFHEHFAQLYRGKTTGEFFAFQFYDPISSHRSCFIRHLSDWTLDRKSNVRRWCFDQWEGWLTGQDSSQLCNVTPQDVRL